MFRATFFTAILVSAMASAQTIDEALVPVDHPAIKYSSAPIHDRVTTLIEDMKSGKVKLEPRKDGTTYLAALLNALGVNQDSQTMVFSKTSFQASRIAPHNPRAVYFSDDMTIGYVRGSPLLEVAAMDPKQGFIFYSFDTTTTPPRFDRRDVCLQCHESIGTSGIPGIMVASVFPDAEGMPAFRGAANLTDHRTRFEDRWGGWYVTGTHGDMRHLGNAIGHEPDHPEVLDTRHSLNLTTLVKQFDPKNYLSTNSDIVALMTLEHQTRMADLMIRVGWEARVIEYEGQNADPASHTRFEKDIDTLVAYMLFADEYELQAPVHGTSGFEKTFPQRGPRDKQGRSLRDFDLEKNLFKYPLSYMVYSDAFDNLPSIAKDRIYHRAYEVLSGKDQSPKFKRLSADRRQAALEILRETKAGLPGYWR
jgi:hypothetical protein